MLPTPTKTPRKRVPAALSSTARILNFKPGSLDEVMPTPRKQRKRHFLDTLDEESLVDPSESIEIFTDSKERMPEVDQSSDNPFVGPLHPEPKRRSAKSKKETAKSAEEAEMEEAVRNDEGIIYVL